MQTLFTILIVTGAVAYMAWQWMPERWRMALLPSARKHGALRSTSGTGPCATCGACSKGA